MYAQNIPLTMYHLNPTSSNVHNLQRIKHRTILLNSTVRMLRASNFEDD